MEPRFRQISFCIVCLVLIVLIIVLLLVWTMPDLPSSVSNNKICLPSRKGHLVCDFTPKRLHDYMETIIPVSYDLIKRQEEEQQEKFFTENSLRFAAIYDEYYLEMKPAAKLTGTELPVNAKYHGDEDMSAIRVWRQGQELYGTNGFLRYGVEYRNGRLVVPVSGTYFIYSYVDLFEECDRISGKANVKNANRQLRHAMYKFNILDEAETEIVSNVQPRVISRNKFYNSYSSFVFSLADLKAGDEISVKVSNISYLKYTQNNFFGLNLI